ncbi:dTDP-glucose 4,6-dehydratase [Hortaea werneckii]|nr:dTDP-glucose 4,6-dehydratase [Hortaea werneckii]
MVFNSSPYKAEGYSGSMAQATASSGQASLDTRFFVDDGLWRKAPMLTGKSSCGPLSDVKNILVTGGEGFIASWLVRHLVIKYPKYNVISFDQLDYCSSLNNSRMLEGRPNFQFFHGDVTSDKDVLRCLRKYDIDTVFHLAAHTHVDLSFGNSYNFTKTNVLGTHILLESAIAVGTIKRFYHVSTDEVYGEVEKDAADLTEQSSLWPTNPYAASKAAAEDYVTAYVKSFRLPAVIVRLNNVYGPHQYPEKIIPKFINLLQRKKPLWIHGDGQHTRRYLFAGDAADAFDTILHRGEIGQIYNVDSRDEISNLDLAGKLLAAFHVKDIAGCIEHTRDRPFNDRRYAVDGTKLRQLGWRQSVSFEEGLAMTVDWYKEFSNWWGSIDAILSPFPVVNGDSITAATLKADEAAAHAQTVTNGNGGLLRGEEATVGAKDEHTALQLPGPSQLDAQQVAGGKKRKAGQMA